MSVGFKSAHVAKTKRSKAKKAKSAPKPRVLVKDDVLFGGLQDHFDKEMQTALTDAYFPEDGVYLVQSGAKESRRISNIGAVPDPFDLAKLEQLRAAIEKSTPMLRCHANCQPLIQTSQMLDQLFPLLAREAHEQEVLDATAKALEAAKPTAPTDLASVEDTVRGQTVVTPSDFLNADESMVQREWPDQPQFIEDPAPAPDYLTPAMLRDPVFLTVVTVGVFVLIAIAIQIAKAVR